MAVVSSLVGATEWARKGRHPEARPSQSLGWPHLRMEIIGPYLLCPPRVIVPESFFPFFKPFFAIWGPPERRRVAEDTRTLLGA